ncbi:PKD domain-containing protein [Pedobacter changchengzhani]|uniref:PKD domain-containing protein n=1 Tax=Pedobacter changchengzhani TaxID=2529274 RepID=UPI001A9E25FC|nr:PKD domain-containing protein [Pedobacter changchengzhani]
MKIKNYILLSTLFIALFYSCSKDRMEYAPKPDLKTKATEITVPVNGKFEFEANNTNSDSFTQEWKLDDKVVSTANTYNFVPVLAGDYVLVYTATNNAGTFVYTYKISVPVPVIATSPTSSKFISAILEYAPAPGQHINQLTIGSPEQAQKLVGSITNSVSLGGFGGYIIFSFDHSVVNQTGTDLAIYGNPIGLPYAFAEPGIVMVSRDKNGNGKADDEWFELAGSEYAKTTTIKNYEITYTNPKAFVAVPWTDNQGGSGFVNNSSRSRNFYPLFAKNQETITFKGTLLPSTLSTSGLVTNSAFDWGYTDSYSLGDDYKTNQYNGFDISWAVDATGKKVVLHTVDFIKVYTAQNVNASFLGEISTDVKGAVDLNIK